MPLLGLNACKNAAEVQESKICFWGGNVCWGEQDILRTNLAKRCVKFSCKQQYFSWLFEKPFDRLIVHNQSFTVNKLK